MVPAKIQREAGIKGSDRLKFKASPGSITITVLNKAEHKPTKTELAAIRKGEAQIANGQFKNLTDVLHDLESHRRRVGAKKPRQVSR